jgi:hypothetical protein
MSSGSADGGAFASGAGGETSSGNGGSCAGESFAAELAPLDMNIMLDASGSMQQITGAGVSRWEAMSGALDAFFNDSASADLGVQLAYFPGPRCSQHAECGGLGPCGTFVCDGFFDGGDSCNGNGDCIDGDCVQAGKCANDFAYTCWGTDCGALGACVKPLDQSYCAGGECQATSYSAPVVPLDLLSNNAAALTASINAQFAQGFTPTGPALQGTITAAQTVAGANPDHVVVAVFATDGEPTRCSPTDENGLGAIAAQGLASGIPTFVIGILDSNSATTAAPILNRVAADGGTTSAFIVDPSSSTITQDLINALNAIRGSALPCVFDIPSPTPPEMIAYDQVNLDYTPTGGSTSTLPYVGDASGCGNGGWHYDVDPSQGTPSQIITCPETCALFEEGGDIAIRVGCDTGVPPS